ncbi:MAG TPA: sugar transferase [Chloroflexi bacterium]|jgi:exopolysaccharide biosynthesis polyprenyl glycosylphosphotransferase|nr:sugar transferase [Chloroflexota bacterium]
MTERQEATLQVVGAASRPRQGWRRTRSIARLVVDILALATTMLLSDMIAEAEILQSLVPILTQTTLPSRIILLPIMALWLSVFAATGLYRDDLIAGRDEVDRIIHATTMSVIVILFAGQVYPAMRMSQSGLLLIWLLGMGAIALGRHLLRLLVGRIGSAASVAGLERRAVLIGADEEGQAIAEQIRTVPNTGLCLTGIVDDTPGAEAGAGSGLRIPESVEALNELIDEERITDVIVTAEALSRTWLPDLFRACMRRGIALHLSTGLFDLISTNIRMTHPARIPLLSPECTRISGMHAIFKTALDYSIALLGLTLASPFLLIIALLIKLDSPGPVFHRRRVLGLHGHEFDAFKFRTMVVNADEWLKRDAALRQAFERNHKMNNDPRITRVGHILRRSSLDEIPQLINVLRGEMSIVGPRMITPEEHERYGKWGTNLLTVKPGITGLWQVSGRADLSYDERVRLDMAYIRNCSIWMDIRLLFRTVGAVLRGVGAY